MSHARPDFQVSGGDDPGKGAEARCGEEAEQKILTQCPHERFCALPSGEVCIYGIEEIPQMTQITTKELGGIVCPPGLHSSMASVSLSSAEIVLLGVTFAVGAAAGQFWHKINRCKNRNST